MTYEEWCKSNTNIVRLVRTLKSSVPEQYIGFYLGKVFGDEVEYQKYFDWLGRHSLDIYISSLQLAIEYDGEYYHRDREDTDIQKTSCCLSRGIYLIRIKEMKATQDISYEKNEVSYYNDRNYTNIDNAIQSLCILINEKYGTEIQIDVDIDRDYEEILSYVQSKYYKKTIAYRWPESKNYWLEEKNKCSIYDVFYTSNKRFALQCPYCQNEFTLNTMYRHNKKSFVPCECEYGEIEHVLEETITKYKKTGEIVTFDDSLWSRRLYDKMVQRIQYFLNDASKEEIEMYKKLGFESTRLDYYLSCFEQHQK